MLRFGSRGKGKLVRAEFRVFFAMSDLTSLPRVALGGIVTFRYGLPIKEIHISLSVRTCPIKGSIVDPSVGDGGSHWWESRFCSR